MLTNAGANATERGELCNWSDEDVAAALDIETEFVASIRDAMQGKTLDGDRLRAWDKRQPKREDGAAERAKAWRERNRTQPNAPKRPDADSDSDSDSESEVIGQPENSEQAPASGPVEVSGLNGSTQFIVESFANWLSPYAPDFAAAHKSIAEAVQIYGPDAVRDGFADLKADHADGKVRALSVKAFYGFVRTAKERKGKAMADRSASGKPMSSGAAWHEEKRRNSKIILALAKGEAVPQ
jgi:hypothetical protein